MKAIIVRHFPAFFGWHHTARHFAGWDHSGGHFPAFYGWHTHSAIILANGGNGGHGAGTIGIWFVATIAVFVLATIIWGKKA